MICISETSPTKEVAPGVDIQRDILNQMDFEPVIPVGGPVQMPTEIFTEHWGSLAEIINSK